MLNLVTQSVRNTTAADSRDTYLPKYFTHDQAASRRQACRRILTEILFSSPIDVNTKMTSKHILHGTTQLLIYKDNKRAVT